MANPVTSPAADAARAGFDNTVDQLVMPDLVKGIRLPAGITLASDEASNSLPKQVSQVSQSKDLTV